MKVSLWKGGTYGIRIRRSDMHHFQKNWKSVKIEIGGRFHTFELSKTFWTTCPELRGGVIAKWIIANNLTKWKKYCPPKVSLIQLSKNNFRLQK